MTSTDGLVAETTDRLLAACCTPDTLERAQADGWCAPVWDRLVTAGFTHISLPEQSGGSGGSLGDAAEVLKALGRYTASVPFAETALLGGWLLANAGLAIPEGPLAVVPELLSVRAGRIVGRTRVAWAAQARAITALVDAPDGPIVVSISPSDVHDRTRVKPGWRSERDGRIRRAADAGYQRSRPGRRRYRVAASPGRPQSGPPDGGRRRGDAGPDGRLHARASPVRPTDRAVPGRAAASGHRGPVRSPAFGRCRSRRAGTREHGRPSSKLRQPRSSQMRLPLPGPGPPTRLTVPWA